MSPYYIKSVIWSEFEVKIIVCDTNNESNTREVILSPINVWRIEELKKRNPDLIFHDHKHKGDL